MTHTQHPAKTTHTPTGAFAMLRALLLRRDDGGASSAVPRHSTSRVVGPLSLVVVLMGLFAITASTALADYPGAEPPLLTVVPSATNARLHAVIDPNQVREPGNYQFLYKAGSECEGGAELPLYTPAPYHGEHGEEISRTLYGLTPGREYTVCMRVKGNNEGEKTSAPVTFTTTVPPAGIPETLKAEAVTSTTATLNGVLNPKGKGEAGSYEFLYEASASECQAREEQQQEATPNLPAAGEAKEAESANVTGLLPGTTYTVCLQSRGKGGEEILGSAVHFTTPAAPPTVGVGVPLQVTSTEATVSANINPGGASTGYQVEYGLTGSPYESKTAEQTLSASSRSVEVRVRLSGLKASSLYHFRFVADRGPVLGEDTTFTTQAAGVASTGLPDGRVYELVSTSGDAGEPYYPTSPLNNQLVGGLAGEHPFEAAERGEAVTYTAEPPAVSGGTGEIGQGLGDQWLATRTPTGWKTGVITPAPKEFDSYEAFSPDLATGFVIGHHQPLTPEVPEGCGSLYARSASSGAYRALFTASEAHAENSEVPCGRPLFAGASADESQVIFQSEAALTGNAQDATELPPGRRHNELGGQYGEACMFGCNLYDSIGGHLTLVNVVEGKTVPNATFGGYSPEVQESELADFSNAISTDGSRIFWTDTQEGTNFEHVYVLENGSSNVLVSGAGQAEYWTATPDGRYAYYTEAGELWRFDTDTNTRERLTAEGAGVEGVIGTNQTGEDEAYLYFVATGVLASNENANKETAQQGHAEGLPNLYVRHAGQTTFIATLSPQDNRVRAAASNGAGDWRANLGERTAEVTPDGLHLVFQSLRPLTGYNNFNHAAGQSVVEAFVYSAGTAQLACASCDPTGATPSKQEAVSEESRLPISMVNNTYMHRWISADGSRVFFDSEQPLLPQDTNEVQDVYEWEREGTPGCPSATSRYGGCVFVLSGGNSHSYSFLVDADASGDNVFLEHVGPLGEAEAPADHNELYDVRVNGGFPNTSLSCTGTGCQGVPPAPPSFATPSSVTFNGIGNFPPPSPPAPAPKPAPKPAKCKKGFVKKHNKKHTKCVKNAKKKAKKASRASNHRRARP